MKIPVGESSLVLLRGDITQQDTDAIVNAANSGLLGGGGVDGAIHRAGGPQILEECRAIRKKQGECPTGQAVITSAGRLKARHVIHAVGPIWHGGTRNEDDLLRRAYLNSLNLAVENGATSIAFPSISTGAYGFPIERAADVAFKAVEEFVRTHPQIREVRFIAFSQHDYDIYARLFNPA
jgi:O-acetyl-ADP-ribose deacetylase (regulator of RNase III)